MSDVVVPLVAMSAAVTIAGRLAAGDSPRPRILIGGLLVGVALTGLDDFAPSLATAFAAVIFITSILTAGPELINRLNPSKPTVVARKGALT